MGCGLALPAIVEESSGSLRPAPLLATLYLSAALLLELLPLLMLPIVTWALPLGTVASILAGSDQDVEAGPEPHAVVHAVAPALLVVGTPKWCAWM